MNGEHARGDIQSVATALIPVSYSRDRSWHFGFDVPLVKNLTGLKNK